MKKVFVTWIFAAAAWCTFAQNSEVVNLWSGREQSLPGNGEWQISADHGRILASGRENVKINLPALIDGTTLHATLRTKDTTQTIRFWSPRPLAGTLAGCTGLPGKMEKKLMEYGLSHSAEKSPDIWFCNAWPQNADGRLFLIFPEERDFPMNLDAAWKEIQLKRCKIPGKLGVLLDRKERVLDSRADFSYVLLRDSKKTCVFFSPGFDLEQMENMVLIKQLIEENKK